MDSLNIGRIFLERAHALTGLAFSLERESIKTSREQLVQFGNQKKAMHSLYKSCPLTDLKRNCRLV